MNIKKHIPNAITCCNLLCGCLALVQAFEGNLVYAAYLVGLGAIFDFFDGFAARMLKVSSPIGKDLDSLTDMVTFGVVPGVVMYKLIQLSTNSYYEDHQGDAAPFLFPYLKYIGFLITVFSAIRLAKFNNDTRQSESFIGLPTPANAIIICALPLILYFDFEYVFLGPNVSSSKTLFFDGLPIGCTTILGAGRLSVLSLILGFLLISELPLFALKFKHFKWKENEIRFVFLGLSLILLITLQFVGIPLIIILYILLSVINNFMKKKAVS